MPPPQQIGQALRYFQKWAFSVTIDGVVVGGFTKAGPLKQTMGVAEQHEGGAITVVDITPTRYKTEKVTLERGGSDNDELWQWWKNQKLGIPDKRNVSIAALDSAGAVRTRWNLSLCSIVSFTAAEFDAKNETENVIEALEIMPTDMDRV